MKHFGGLDGAVSPFLTTVAGSKIKATHLADILPEANGFLPFDVTESFGRIRTFKIKKGDLDAMRAEMETAYREELAAARAIEQAGQKTGGAA